MLLHFSNRLLFHINHQPPYQSLSRPCHCMLSQHDNIRLTRLYPNFDAPFHLEPENIARGVFANCLLSLIKINNEVYIFVWENTLTLYKPLLPVNGIFAHYCLRVDLYCTRIHFWSQCTRYVKTIGTIRLVFKQGYASETIKPFPDPHSCYIPDDVLKSLSVNQNIYISIAYWSTVLC